LPESSPNSADEIASEVIIISFIVRVWREEPSSKEHEEVWRGHITPIREGTRHYFSNINEIPALIEAHLRAKSSP
jgi:hypothetical protein